MFSEKGFEVKNKGEFMEYWLGVVIGILVIIIFYLLIRLSMIRKVAREIEEEFARRLKTDTNTLISISYQDKNMRKLADSVNRELRKLRSERQRFQQGDLELKEAITNISHDLRTPLTAIYGYLELLERENKSENATRYLAQIENRVEVLKQLTEELFRYSVVTSTKKLEQEKIDIRRVLEESLVSFYGAMQQKKIIPNISIPEVSIERFVDPIALNRIFGNIISNALKYSDGDFAVVMEKTGKIIFSNTARGIDTVTVGRLFDRFYTVETGRNSTGLGLSIAKLLTERMGGTIYADYYNSKLDIVVYFPVDIFDLQLEE